MPLSRRDEAMLVDAPITPASRLRTREGFRCCAALARRLCRKVTTRRRAVALVVNEDHPNVATWGSGVRRSACSTHSPTGR